MSPRSHLSGLDSEQENHDSQMSEKTPQELDEMSRRAKMLIDGRVSGRALSSDDAQSLRSDLVENVLQNNPGLSEDEAEEILKAFE